MPAKKQVSKEVILSAALDIARERGVDNLNVRDIARACNCSTQPVYLSFESMDDLKISLCGEIYKVYTDYLKREVESGKYPEYKAVGLAYIKFAKQEKQLFRYLFMRARNDNSDAITDQDFVNEVERLRKLGFCNGKEESLHLHMWIFVHGIATMFATGFLELQWEQVENLLTEEFNAVRGYYERA